MSDFFVMPQYASLRGKLVLKTVIYYSKLLGFQNFACLKLEHYSSDKTLWTDTIYTGSLQSRSISFIVTVFNTLPYSFIKLSLFISLNVLNQKCWSTFLGFVYSFFLFYYFIHFG